MKKLLLLFLLIPTFGQAQYFSGEITYELKIIPKSDTVDLEEIISLKHGTTASYVITAKHYKSSYFKNGEYSYSYTYDDQTKRMFDDYSEQQYITYRDSRKANYEYHGSQVFRDSSLTILGHDSYMVLTDSEYGSSKTYYSDDIRVNYADFEGHKVGNWYNKLKEVNGAISLLTITDHETYYEIQEAVRIDKRDVKDIEFSLPDKPLAASFEALDQQVALLQPTQEQIQCYQEKVGAASIESGEKYASFVSFLVQKDGTLKFIEAYEKDDNGLYKVAVEIIKSCGFKFSPGIIDGEPVDSQAFFPIEFLR